MKNVYLLQLSSAYWDFISVFWPSAKTYYEKHGLKKYNWVNPICEHYTNIDDLKAYILKNPPDVFGVSLYVWNYERSLNLCKWVKETWPNCLVITGGPHQFFHHDNDWFKKYSFIDASLPGEAYGELAICDILDNLKDDNTVDWTLVEQIAYPKYGLVQYSQKNTPKRNFNWDYSGYASQYDDLTKYINEYRKIKPNGALVVGLETTRGCPFSCTYCDWGGGIGTKIIKKDVTSVKQDLDTLASWGLELFMFCDGNFGIGGQRDIDILNHVIKLHRNSAGVVFSSIFFSGLAKSNKSIDILREILSLGAANQLITGYRISQQVFDEQTLKNIKRTDVSWERRIGLAKHLQKKYKLESVVELIMGLPGVSTEIWYKEFDLPYQSQIWTTAFTQYVNPEAENYSSAYRDQWKLLTSRKIKAGNPYEPQEIVVGHFNCTKDDFKDQLTIYAAYFFLVQCGVYADSIRNFLTKNNLEFSVLLRKFVEEFLPLWKQSRSTIGAFDKFLEEFVQDEHHLAPELDEGHSLYHPETNTIVKYYGYLAYDFYQAGDLLTPLLEQWLASVGVDQKQLSKERPLLLHKDKSGQKRIGIFRKINYDKYATENQLIDAIDIGLQSWNGKILRAS